MTVAGKSGTGTVKVESSWFQSNRERLEKAATILAKIEEKKLQRKKCESEIEVLDNEIAGLAENYELIRNELDQALTRTGIKRLKAKKGVQASRPEAARRSRGGTG